MSRIGNKIRAGFFATPARQGEYLTKLLHVEGSGSWLDPTCGEGEILHQISSPFQGNGITINTYGVELDKKRAEKAKKNLTYCVNSPIESMVIQNNAFSLVFLNPPYDSTQKGIGDDLSERKEWIELYRGFRYLKEDGLLIYIIPSYRFSDKKIARFLATHFYHIGIMRFSDEDYPEFKQCIFIGNKKKGEYKEFNQKLYDVLLKMEDENFVQNNISPITDFVKVKHKWRVPSGVGIDIKTFYSKFISKSDLVEGIKNSNGFQAFLNHSKSRLTFEGQPILPLNVGQLTTLLAAGAINGEIGQGETYHLVQGLEIVKKVTEESKENQKNITIVKTRREASVKIITPQGLIKKLV